MIFFSHLPVVSSATFSRHGGASEAPYHSRNVGLQVGDDEALVLRNRTLIREELGLSRLVSARQVHGDSVLVVDWLPEADFEQAGYDALMTNIPGLGLMIQQADCQAIMLYDPEHAAVANIHSGWLGSVANIIGKTVTAILVKISFVTAGCGVNRSKSRRNVQFVRRIIFPIAGMG